MQDQFGVTFRTIKFRRGTTLEHSTFTGAAGEITVDTNKWTAIVHDGTTVGGFPLRIDAVAYPRVRYLMFRAAAVQQGVASLGFSSPLNNGPRPVVVADDDLIVGAASFDTAHNQSIQEHFLLPANWFVDDNNPFELDIVWRSNTTIGSVIWWLETCCVPVGELIERHTFTTKQLVTTVALGTEQKLTTSTINVDTTDFVPNGELFFRLTRAGGDDTIGVPVELLSLRFSIRIKEN